jgi:outer membrane biosynthesis protein TonB
VPPQTIPTAQLTQRNVIHEQLPPLPPVPPAVSPAQVEPEIQTGPQPGALTTAAIPPDIRVMGRNVLPSTVDYYPPGKRRAGIEGASYVRVCVDAHGLRHGEPQLERSSGDVDLDGSALNMARHGRYARSLQGDVPVPNCYHFRIVFQIK